MADEKITQLAAMLGADLAAGDLFAVVDVSDTSMAPSGTDKKITKSELASVLGGSGIPAATAFTTTTMPNPITGSGNMTVLQFPADTAVLASGLVGDTYPRLLMPSDTTDAVFYLGDGTFDPFTGLAFLGFSNFFGPSGAIGMSRLVVQTDIYAGLTVSCGDLRGASGAISIGALTDHLGFFGAAAIAQPAHPTTLADVITLLTNLGLCA